MGVRPNARARRVASACAPGAKMARFPPMPCPPSAATLACHPGTPSAAVRGIAVSLCRAPRNTLAITYVLEGDLARVRVPAPRAPRAADRLWQHTCCEIFVARRAEPAYH